MTVLAIYLVIWGLLGLLVGALAGIVSQGAPPFGLGTDIAVSVLTMAGVGLLDYAVLPLMGYKGRLRFIAAVVEPLIGAILVLWLLRIIRRRRDREKGKL
jgi:uncharacterized membrane protein YeaQ/YmgE (transglycosylase-associated protein family)